MPKILTLILCFIGLTSFQSLAQTVPIGQWKTHYTYNQHFSVDEVEDLIYFGGTHLVEYSKSTQEFNTFSKVNGLSDVNIKLIRHDALTGYTILVYENANIDLLKDNIFYNIPDIKNLNTIGSKQINSAFFKNNFIYLCTDLGIVVLDPNRKEIKETYVLKSNSTIAQITGITSKSGKFVVTSNKGIFTADESNPALQNFNNWTLENTTPLKDILLIQDSIYAIDDNKMYAYSNQTLTARYTSKSEFKRFRKGNTNFYACESGDDSRRIVQFDVLGNMTDSIQQVNPYDMVEVSPTEIWVADYWEGSTRILNKTQKDVIRPKGIYDNSIYNMSFGGNDVFVAAGNQSGWQVTYNSAGISRINPAGDWTWYNRFNNTAGLDQVVDILDVAIDERNSTIYGASYFDGLWEWHTDNTAVNYENTDFLQPFGGFTRVAGLKFDRNYNLWMSNYGADKQLVVKKADGTWQNFSLPYAVSEKGASQILIDDADQKWILAPRGIGIFVMNDNNTIDNKDDDKIKFLRNGEGSGNLPSTFVNCLEKDKNGKIWVGTSDGIAIYNCPENMFGTGSCDGELRVVKYDVDAGLLFQNENVRTIATDGANNKWIGTDNGVWQISDDAEKILQRFTVNNSPLPSNDINKIIVHPITGEVFIGTEKGLITYRGQATDGQSTNDNLLIFPNPVQAEYSGMIAIKGLVENADVRITDVSGQLVYRTKAQGGQAVWNGKNYLGNKPRTGIYYVFVTNEDGSQTKSGKFIFNE